MEVENRQIWWYCRTSQRNLCLRWNVLQTSEPSTSTRLSSVWGGCVVASWGHWGLRFSTMGTGNQNIGRRAQNWKNSRKITFWPLKYFWRFAGHNASRKTSVYRSRIYIFTLIMVTTYRREQNSIDFDIQVYVSENQPSTTTRYIYKTSYKSFKVAG